MHKGTTFRRAVFARVRRPAAWAAYVLACAVASTPARAQDMDVPVPTQVSLFLKVLTFDRQLSTRPGDGLVVGVAYQGGNRASTLAKDEVMRALASELFGPDRAAVRGIAIDLDTEDLGRTLTERRVTVLYVAPLRGADIGTIATTARAARVRTVTGVPHYVALGVAIGVARRGERPKLLMNLRAARFEGADFSAELLKLAELVR